MSRRTSGTTLVPPWASIAQLTVVLLVTLAVSPLVRAGEALAQTPNRFRSAEPARPDSAWTDRGVHVTMRWTPDRSLHWETVVPAPVAEVWAAWTVPAEMISWAGPGAEVDLRPGGFWEVHFNPERPKGQRGSDANELLAVVPHRELQIAAGAPLEFPTVRAEKTLFTVRFEPVGHHHTRLRISQTGWKSGDEWTRAFEYLAGGNAEWLNWLHHRFVHGPIDWSQGPPGR